MKEQLADIKGKNGIMDGEDSGGKTVKIVVIKGPKMLATAESAASWVRLRKLKDGILEHDAKRHKKRKELPAFLDKRSMPVRVLDNANMPERTQRALDNKAAVVNTFARRTAGQRRKLKEGVINEFVPKPGTHGRPLVPEVPGGPGKFEDREEYDRNQKLKQLERLQREMDQKMREMREQFKRIEAYEKYLLQQLKELDLRDAGEEPPPGNYWNNK